MQVGVHFAQVWIDESKDDQERATLEQARATMVRRTAVACTQASWSEEMRGCMNAAKKRADTQACEQKLQQLQPAPAK